MTHEDRSLRALPWIAAAATVVFHLLANPHYGFFRDELYFIMCGFRPDWGYVDQPPLVPLLAAATQLGGHSLVLLRAVPALFAAGAVFVAIGLAARLGGGLFARVLTAIVVALSPVLAAFGGKVGTDEANPLLWTLAAYALLRFVRGEGRWALVAGAAMGVALETKYSAIFFAFALVAALLLVPERRRLASGWMLGGVALCVLIALPSGLWQWAHGWPMLELLRNGQHGKNVVVGPLAYLGQEVLITGPLFAPVWIAGLVLLATDRTARFLALAFVLLIAAMIVLHGKHYYPAAVYPIPFAAGCVALEACTARLRFVRPVLAALAVLAGVAFLPLAL
ncbi:MAG TPA: glycosyltransferase family 39 protein, partial [Candidatus Elarobacter sp.]|nr:glycosyltransferase family 39 protein [Candidatus Elarobacter sp.]